MERVQVPFFAPRLSWAGLPAAGRHTAASQALNSTARERNLMHIWGLIC